MSQAASHIIFVGMKPKKKYAFLAVICQFHYSKGVQ